MLHSDLLHYDIFVRLLFGIDFFQPLCILNVIHDSSPFGVYNPQFQDVQPTNGW